MEKLKNLKKNKKGFTLIEMIVVIVIIAILAAIAVPAVMKYIDEARDTKLIAHASSAKTSLEAELAKVQAADADGKFKASDVSTALEAVKNDVKDVTTATVCKIQTNSSAVKIDGANASCSDSTTPPTTIKEIGGYIFTVGGKTVVVENDGSAEVIK